MREIGLTLNTRVWLVAGYPDMREGFDGLAGVVRTALTANPFDGNVLVFHCQRALIDSRCCGSMATAC